MSMEIPMPGNTDSRELEMKVKETLAQIPDLDLDAATIKVHADGHTVTLEGELETIGNARKVELAALSVDGVHHVLSHMETGPADERVRL